MQPQNLTIAVASGKGGTGKTTVSTSLALSSDGYPILLVDCDVEAPNSHLFFDTKLIEEQTVTKRVPVVDFMRCTYCGACAKACEFHAISVMNHAALANKDVMIFSDLCHSCGVCSFICPEHAIKEIPEDIGKIKTYAAQNEIKVISGEMKIGSAMPVPVIKAVKQKAYSEQPQGIMNYDSPPGNSCSVVETIKDVDYVILVTEPTPFGLHDLKLTVKLAEELQKPTGVIINRHGIGTDDVENYLNEKHIPVLMKIPYDAVIAHQLSQGVPLALQSTEWKARFTRLLNEITEEVNR